MHFHFCDFSPQQHHEKQHHEKGKHWPSCPFTIIIGTTVKVHIIMYWENPYIFIAIYTVSLNCYKYIGFIHLFQKLIFNMFSTMVVVYFFKKKNTPPQKWGCRHTYMDKNILYLHTICFYLASPFPHLFLPVGMAG